MIKLTINNKVKVTITEGITKEELEDLLIKGSFTLSKDNVKIDEPKDINWMDYCFFN